MRIIAPALLFVATTLVGPSAFAQHVHHDWCLIKGSSHECAYDTVAQCVEAKSGTTERCVRNNAAINH
jgi:hypothetical protein